VDIYLIRRKNQRKTSSNGINIVLYKEIGVKESNVVVKILTESSRSAHAVKIFLTHQTFSAFVKISKIYRAKVIKQQILSSTTSQFKTVCKDDSCYIRQLEQQQEGQHPLTGQRAANFR